MRPDHLAKAMMVDWRTICNISMCVTKALQAGRTIELVVLIFLLNTGDDDDDSDDGDGNGDDDDVVQHDDVDVVEGVSLLSIVEELLTGRQWKSAFGKTMTSTLMMLVRAC